MPLLHHISTGTGSTGTGSTGTGAPPIVFVHGFACDHTDWAAQMAHLSRQHSCVAVDLRGHGNSPGDPMDCSVERNGADVAAVMRARGLPPAILVGHSMGCRVVVEAALQAPEHVAGIILVDGSQFAPAMGPALRQLFATPAGFATVTGTWFKDMFTAKSNPAVVAAALARAGRMPRPTGEKLLTDLQRYDVTRLESSLAGLQVPVMAIQTTFSNEKRERRPMVKGQTTPYLDMLRARVPAVRVEIIPDTGHFPQLDEAAKTNALMADFLAGLAVRSD